MNSCTMHRFEASDEGGRLRVALSRHGVRTLRLYTLLAFLATAATGTWMLLQVGHPNWWTVFAYVVITTTMFVAMTWYDSGFTPIEFDRHADRIVRRGGTIGRLADVRCVWIADRGSEEGIRSYHVLLVKAGARADRDEVLDLGKTYEKNKARAFAAVIAEFLGVAIGEGYEPNLALKAEKAITPGVDLEW